jgi:hypothetical protein
MNIVYLSPHFPPNYHLFCVHLKALGANVLGLADEPYEFLNPRLKESLSEYYQVRDLHNYDELLRAIGYFTHRYGKIDRIDSQNEYWLETEAQLRTDFNIYGIKNDSIGRIKRKSLMKEVFLKAGLPAARGRVVQNLAEAEALIQETGYPVIAKPDVGVGAAKTYKIHDQEGLESFFIIKPAMDYIMEEFVDGVVCSFDGLTDRDGQPVFYTAHEYSQGVLESVSEGRDIYYYSYREIPLDLEEAGCKVLSAFDIRERFFHFEFFRRRDDNRLVPLEVNIRPPGGMTTDMFNYANDIDIYHEWAHVILHNRFTAQYTRKYHCAYIGRKPDRRYAHPHEEILAFFGSLILHHEPISGVFSAALGDYGYLARSTDIADIHEMAAFIHQLA